jgi:hypothetical protein
MRDTFIALCDWVRALSPEAFAGWLLVLLFLAFGVMGGAYLVIAACIYPDDTEGEGEDQP